MAGRPKGIAKTGGRQKGTPNKATLAVKEALEAAFEGMGGVERLKAWATSEPTEFYKLWAKMLPSQVNNQHTGPNGGPIETRNLSKAEADKRIAELLAKVKS